jgi:hypothetical protein
MGQPSNTGTTSISSSFREQQLVVNLIDYDGVDFVMPAQAGIQENSALVCGYASWIPGLALLARNDATPATPQNHCDETLGHPLGSVPPLMPHTTVAYKGRECRSPDAIRDSCSWIALRSIQATEFYTSLLLPHFARPR